VLSSPSCSAPRHPAPAHHPVQVFKGMDLKSGDCVAIKQIALAGIASGSLQGVMGEIELLKTLNHKNIVKYVGSFKTRAHLYIILEFMENGALSAIIKPNRFGVFPETLIAVYIAQVLQGLQYLHDQGVVHRDIKGANILTTKEVGAGQRGSGGGEREGEACVCACTLVHGVPLVQGGHHQCVGARQLHRAHTCSTAARRQVGGRTLLVHHNQERPQRNVHTHTHSAMPAACPQTTGRHTHPRPPQGLVKLADFGVATKLGELEEHRSEIHQHVVGTPYWMAPEASTALAMPCPCSWPACVLPLASGIRLGGASSSSNGWSISKHR